MPARQLRGTYDCSKDLPGQQQRMMETTDKILAIVGKGAAAS
jgi:hypothetical protein